MNGEAARTGGKQDADTGESGFSASGFTVPVAVKTQRRSIACKADLISLISAEDARKSEALIDGFLKRKRQNTGLTGNGCSRCS